MSEPATRRRGAALRSEILDAVVEELHDHGYAGVTFDGVARRSHTSKPVLYRRWPSRAHLVVDALTAHLPAVSPAPDTGSLRGDLIALLWLIRARFGDVGAHAIRGIVADADDELRGVMVALTDAFSDEIARTVLQRARDRGEIGPAAIAPRVSALPVILLRHDLLLTGVPSDATIESIVDDVFLPLVRTVTRAEATAPAGDGTDA